MIKFLKQLLAFIQRIKKLKHYFKNWKLKIPLQSSGGLWTGRG
jgi:hypothetical protein